MPARGEGEWRIVVITLGLKSFVLITIRKVFILGCLDAHFVYKMVTSGLSSAPSSICHRNTWDFEERE